jgi:hypothetical protein
MLMEELFSRGTMTMSPSRTDPTKQVGSFPPELLKSLPALRAAEMQKFSWLAGEWNYENRVPATRHNPAYTDSGVGRFALGENGAWICRVAPDGALVRHITFDPFSKMWFYLIAQGAYCLLRSRDGWQDNTIEFTGPMTMLGLDRDWRLRWTKHSNDSFSLVNEELSSEGEWLYIDEWHFTRKS